MERSARTASGEHDRPSVRGSDGEALRVSLLGRFEISAGARVVGEDGWRLRKAASLVKLLALAPHHRLHREQMMELLWRDLGPEAAANNLHQTLHAARRTIDTCQANIDSVLAVYTGGQLDALGRVADNNNGCSGGFGSRLTFNAQRDEIYYISVDGCCGAPQGTFTLALDLVDDVAPQASSLTGSEDGSASSSTSLTFTFDADEPGSTFECRVYPAALTPPAFGSCSGAGSHTASGFSPGTYTFEVRATDAAGNPDATPARRTFSIDTSNPTVETWKPTGKKVSPTAKPSVTFSEAMNGASVEAGANGKPMGFILKKGRTMVPASVAHTEGATTFNAVLSPTRKLQRGTTYTASVTTAAKDEAGNALVAKSWKFRVRP